MFYADGKAHIEKKDVLASITMSDIHVNLKTGKIVASLTHKVIGKIFVVNMWFIVQNPIKNEWAVEFDVFPHPQVLIARSVTALVKVDIYNIFHPMMTAHLRGRAPW